MINEKTKNIELTSFVKGIKKFKNKAKNEISINEYIKILDKCS